MSIDIYNNLLHFAAFCVILNLNNNVIWRNIMITQANWICADKKIGQVCPEFRKSFCPKSKIKNAYVNISALGIYRLFINGKRVSDHLLTPGLTSYTHRIQYQTYDITSLLSEDNTLAIRAGNGWALSDWYWCYTLTPDIERRIRVIAEFVIEYEDGTSESIMTDGSWDTYTSPVTYAELYHGETIDYSAPIEYIGKAEISTNFSTELVSQIGEYVREMIRVAPVKLIITPAGEKVIDFGQNMAGYVEVTRKGKVGDKISFSCAEVLDKYGNFYNANYRQARSIVTYISGGNKETFKPEFTFQGFRYIRLDEYPEENVDISEFTAVAIFSDMKRTGYFRCGHDKINQLYSNIIWGQRSNFVDIPTDCPQRDERFGWTGDAEVFCRTAAINYDVEKFFKKWLGDMRLEQDAEGGVYGIVPAVPPHGQARGAGWGDAATICPFEVYLAYGNREILEENYEMMKMWVEYIRKAGDPDDEYLWVGEFQWADWLAMDAGDGIMFGATQNDLVASAYFANSVDLCRRAAKILGKSDDEAYFADMYSKVRNAFRAAFMKDGMPVIYPKGDAFATNRPVKALTQTALCLILRFNLCEDSERAALANKLVELIAEHDGRMTTGFLGTANILHALSENGKTDAAFDLLFQEKNPSWLFSVNRGATTMWEHWDSMNEEGNFWSTNMNSFNHYAYGAVYDWIFGCVGGVKILDSGAGYSHITLEPHTDKRLGFADCSIKLRNGETLISAWRYLDDGKVRFDFTIPSSTVAEMKLPSGKIMTLYSGEYSFIE